MINDTIKKGSKGSAVKMLQKYLHLAEDGIFGDITEEAVRSFQRSRGLLVDGIVGPITWQKIRKDDAILTRAARPIKEIILHCTGSQEGKHRTVNDIRQQHKKQGWSDIGYHYVIYLDGSLEEGRPVDKIGAHCAGHNTGTIGVVYVGGVDKNLKPKDTRTVQQKETLIKLVKDLIKLYNLKPYNVKGHYEYDNKACPSFDMDEFRKQLK